jgi:hypothetical protein
MTRRRVLGACLAALAAVGVGACGVPIQDHPDAVERDKVPFGLTQDEPHTTSTSTTIPVAPDSTRTS